MSKLPNNQALILKHAAGYVDGAILPLPEDLKLTAGALNRTLGVLRRKGFAEKGDDGVWRVTDAGRSEIGAANPTVKEVADAEPGQRTVVSAGSKQERLVRLLERPEGASIADIQAETSWQPHSVRGAISGVCKKKLGLNVASQVEEGRGRVYRIVTGA